MGRERFRGIPGERVSGGALARMWSDPSIGALAAPGGASGWRKPGAWHTPPPGRQDRDGWY